MGDIPRLCRDLDHRWSDTLAANYRRCTRSGCRAVQRFQDGQWVDVPILSRREKRVSVIVAD